MYHIRHVAVAELCCLFQIIPIPLLPSIPYLSSFLYFWVDLKITPCQGRRSAYRRVSCGTQPNMRTPVHELNPRSIDGACCSVLKRIIHIRGVLGLSCFSRTTSDTDTNPRFGARHGHSLTPLFSVRGHWHWQLTGRAGTCHFPTTSSLASPT